MEADQRTIGIVLGVAVLLLLSAFAGIGPTAVLVDGDRDGTYNWADNCPDVENENQLDFDEDSEGDA